MDFLPFDYSTISDVILTCVTPPSTGTACVSQLSRHVKALLGHGSAHCYASVSLATNFPPSGTGS